MGNSQNRVTIHCSERLCERHIPYVFIKYAMDNGQRTILPDKGVIEYRIKSVLGLKGINLVCVASFAGEAITAYVENTKNRMKSKNS